MLADFTIHIHEARKPLAVRVKIHDNVTALRMAATKHDKARRRDEEGHSETLGICHRIHMANDPVCAIVRLAPPHVGAGMVAHEMGHAAVWLWAIHNKFSATKAPLVCSNDEWFCWVLGELVRRTTDKLHEKGVY